MERLTKRTRSLCWTLRVDSSVDNISFIQIKIYFSFTFLFSGIFISALLWRPNSTDVYALLFWVGMFGTLEKVNATCHFEGEFLRSPGRLEFYFFYQFLILICIQNHWDFVWDSFFYVSTSAISFPKELCLHKNI